MALVKSLVEEMHGEVGVESTLGQGSMFGAEFPLCDAPEQSDELDFGQRLAGGRPRDRARPGSSSRSTLRPKGKASWSGG